jgi:hypothetical protein
MTVVSFGFPELKLLGTEKRLGGKEGERPIVGMREERIRPSSASKEEVCTRKNRDGEEVDRQNRLDVKES